MCRSFVRAKFNQSSRGSVSWFLGGGGWTPLNVKTDYWDQSTAVYLRNKISKIVFCTGNGHLTDTLYADVVICCVLIFFCEFLLHRRGYVFVAVCHFVCVSLCLCVCGSRNNQLDVGGDLEPVPLVCPCFCTP